MDCKICMDTAKEAVLTPCGHSFCWPCLYRWLQTCPITKDCPTCKRKNIQDYCTPMYGSEEISDRDNTIPPRPKPRREGCEIAQSSGRYGSNHLGMFRDLIESDDDDDSEDDFNDFMNNFSDFEASFEAAMPGLATTRGSTPLNLSSSSSEQNLGPPTTVSGMSAGDDDDEDDVGDFEDAFDDDRYPSSTSPNSRYFQQSSSTSTRIQSPLAGVPVCQICYHLYEGDGISHGKKSDGSYAVFFDWRTVEKLKKDVKRYKPGGTSWKYKPGELFKKHQSQEEAVMKIEELRKKFIEVIVIE